MKNIPVLDFMTFARKYCDRQEQTPEGLHKVLTEQKQRFNPEGWVLLECQIFGSSSLGSLTIVPYGPNNTFKAPPEHPVSPRGMASDTSVVVAILLADSI